MIKTIKRVTRVFTRVNSVALRAVFAAALISSASCSDDSSTGPAFNSVTLIPAGTVVPLNGTVEVTARVTGISGERVPDGTVIRFTCCASTSAGAGADAAPGVLAQTSESGSLGTVSPEAPTTVGGQVTVTFTAGTRSGVARIGASVGGGRETEIELLVGTAAATKVTLTSSLAVVPSGGGSVDITATVLDAAGNGVVGVPVTFATSAGSISLSSVVSGAGGHAVTRLTTTREATVTASIGTVVAPAATTVRVSPAPTVTTVVTPVSPIVGQVTQFAFNLGVQSGGAALRDLVVDFGDGTKRTLTGMNPGTLNIAQTYNATGVFTVTATVTDVSGESATATSIVAVQPRPPVLIEVTVNGGNPATIVKNVPVVFAVTVAPASEQARVVRYEWDFGDLTPTVTVNSASISHVYTSSAVRTYKLTVVLSDNQRLTTEGSIFVKEQ